MKTLSTSRSLAVLVLAVGPGGLLRAQDPMTMGDPAPSSSLIPPISYRESGTVFEDQGRLRAGGPVYKAELSRSGFRFVPALGEAAPTNYPWEYTLIDVHREPDPYLAAAPASPAREGNRVVYDRGGGIEEIFEARGEGLEIQYVFAGPVPGSGDLVVRSRVRTDLHAAPAFSREGIAFLLEGVGGVSVGGVTGLDANGDSAEGALRWDGEFLEMILPAAFVDKAAYPLVLDPLVGAQLLVSSTINDDANADVAYNYAEDQYLVVWQRFFSTVDSDIRAQRVDASDGTRIGSWIAVTSSGDVEKNPTVANVSATNQFLVAWQASTSAFGEFDIDCRTVRPDGTVSASIVSITATGADEVDPDAGGESTPFDDEAIVVWTEVGAGIRAKQVTVRATGDPNPFGLLNVTSNSNDRHPAISKHGGAVGRYVVAFEREFSTGFAIYGQAITRDTALAGTILPIAFNTSLDELQPDVDGNGVFFMVAFARQESPGSHKHDIFCRVVEWTGSDLAVASPVRYVEKDSSDDEREPAVAWLGPKYLVAWSDEAGFLNYDIGMKAIAFAGCIPCGHEIVFTGSRVYDSLPEIASKKSGNSATSSDECLVTFETSDITPPYFFTDIWGQRFEAFGAGGASVNRGGGCGNGGTIYTTGGPVSLGNGAFTVRVNGLDRGITSTVMWLDLPQSTLRCGTCSFLGLGAPLVSFPPSSFGGGEASRSLPIPCDIAYFGLSLDLQWVSLGSSQAACSIVPGLAASDILRITLGI